MFGVLSILAFLAFVGLAIAYFLDRTIDPVTQKVQYPWYRNYYLYGAMAALFLFIMFLLAYLYSVRKEQEGMPSSPSSPSLPSDVSLSLLSPSASLSSEPNQQKSVPPGDDNNNNNDHANNVDQDDKTEQITLIIRPFNADIYIVNVDRGSTRLDLMRKLGREEPKIFPFRFTKIVRQDDNIPPPDGLFFLFGEDEFFENKEVVASFVQHNVAQVPEKELFVYPDPNPTDKPGHWEKIPKGEVLLLDHHNIPNQNPQNPMKYMKIWKIRWKTSEGHNKSGYVSNDFLRP